MLEIVPSYPRIQFQGKRIIQTQKNDEKPHFGLDLGSFDPILTCHIFVIKLVVKGTCNLKENQ